MTLQERLRANALALPSEPPREGDTEWVCRNVCTEAADALDAKDARIKELEGALREIARGMCGGQIMYASECWAIAREALK